MAKKRKLKKGMIIFSIINIIAAIIFILFVISLKVVPTKYIIIVSIVLLIFNILMFLLLKSRKKLPKIFGYILSIIFILIYIVGIYYIYKTNDFLGKSFDNAKNTYTNTYYVVTLKDELYEELDELKGMKLGYYKELPNIDIALDKLETKVTTIENEYTDLNKTFTDLDNSILAAILIEQNMYEFVKESNDNFDEDDYDILYEFDIEIEENIKETENKSDFINIYIGGTDFTNLYTDFNMIVTINKDTHKILLTSTPRDFYVQVADKGGARDLLGYAGVWGINSSLKTIENLYGINIDYYVKINTNSLVGLVDTLGGLEFCSDISYTTTHALVTDTYDDTKDKKLNVIKGCREYNGVQILTIARERKAYRDGDRQRQKNCQTIMISIFKKIASTGSLTKYSSILDSVSDLYTTNMPSDVVTDLAKETLDGNSWTFEQQSVTGRDSSGFVHLSNVKDYVMIPNQDSVDAATKKIEDISKGK